MANYLFRSSHRVDPFAASGREQELIIGGWRMALVIFLRAGRPRSGRKRPRSGSSLDALQVTLSKQFELNRQSSFVTRQ
jgi:hypothetical protein